MTSLLTRPDHARPDAVRPRPLVLIATLGGAMAALGPLVVLLAIGLVLFLLIWALFGGSNGARWITTVLLVLGLLSNIEDVVGAERGGVTAWFSGLLAVIALVCLWGTPGAAEFFARPRPARQMPPPPPQTPLG